LFRPFFILLVGFLKIDRLTIANKRGIIYWRSRLEAAQMEAGRIVILYLYNITENKGTKFVKTKSYIGTSGWSYPQGIRHLEVAFLSGNT
jgi:hypothetical protein